MDAGRGIPVILKRPLTMETATALIQRQTDNYFLFKKPQDSLGEERQRHRKRPLEPASSSGPTMSVQWCLNTGVSSAPPSPTCLPASQGEGRHLGFQVGQGWLEFLQGRQAEKHRLWKELGQQGTWTSIHDSCHRQKVPWVPRPAVLPCKVTRRKQVSETILKGKLGGLVVAACLHEPLSSWLDRNPGPQHSIFFFQILKPGCYMFTGEHSVEKLLVHTMKGKLFGKHSSFLLPIPRQKEKKKKPLVQYSRQS